jgi:hypothetical protein
MNVEDGREKGKCLLREREREREEKETKGVYVFGMDI